MFAWYGRWCERTANKHELRMARWGWTLPTRDLFWHYWQLFKEQVAAVIPISLLQVGLAP
jgi:hypothetical protein